MLWIGGRQIMDDTKRPKCWCLCGFHSVVQTTLAAIAISIMLSPNIRSLPWHSPHQFPDTSNAHSRSDIQFRFCISIRIVRSSWRCWLSVAGRLLWSPLPFSSEAIQPLAGWLLLPAVNPGGNHQQRPPDRVVFTTWTDATERYSLRISRHRLQFRSLAAGSSMPPDMSRIHSSRSTWRKCTWLEAFA